MKEERLYDVMMLFFKKHDECTMQQLYHWIDKYRKKHNCYVPYDRDELDYVVYTLAKNELYWDAKANVLRKQDYIICPCCETKFLKYPDTDKFYGIIAWIEETNEYEQKENN